MKKWLKPTIVVLLAWATYVISITDRMAWAPVIPLASAEMGITAAQAGLYMTAFYVGYVLTQFPGGLLTDRIGYRKVLLGSIGIVAIFTIAMYFVKSFEMGLIVRFLAGLGSGAIFSAATTSIIDHIPAQRRGLAIGFLMTATSLGITFANIIVPTVADHFGWRTAFLAVGCFPILGFILSFFFMKESSNYVERKSVKETTNFWQDTLTILKNKKIIIVGLAGFGGTWAAIGTATWANSYLNNSLGLTLVQAGSIMAFYGMAGLIVKPLIGFISDYMNKKVIAFWALFLFAPVLVWFGMNTITNFTYLLILTIVLGTASFMYSPIMTTIIGETVEPRLVGGALGLVNGIWQLGALASPLIMGMVIDQTGSYLLVFITLAAGPFVGAIIMLFLGSGKSKTYKETSDGDHLKKAI